jgi:hypothetical protein
MKNENRRETDEEFIARIAKMFPPKKPRVTVIGSSRIAEALRRNPGGVRLVVIGDQGEIIVEPVQAREVVEEGQRYNCITGQTELERPGDRQPSRFRRPQ